MPIEQRIALSCLRLALVIDWPSIMMSPPVMSLSRLMERSSVLLPAPLGPMMATNSPSRMVRLTSLRPSTPLPYSLVTPHISIMVFLSP